MVDIRAWKHLAEKTMPITASNGTSYTDNPKQTNALFSIDKRKFIKPSNQQQNSIKIRGVWFNYI